LNECLSRLLPHIEYGSSIRVLIIDNNSSDETKQTVSIKQEKYHSLDYAFCKEQGLSHARNYALKEADSIWLSFLDDDGYPDDDWLKENLRIMLTSPITALIVSYSFVKKFFRLKKRLVKIKRHCEKSDATKIMIWGANDYPKALVSYLAPKFTIVNIIDSRASKKYSTFMGINLIGVQSISHKELAKVDTVVLATDEHVSSMKHDFFALHPNAMGKILKF
jgi:glycosyltransferase involved in cell wall biosynthesis